MSKKTEKPDASGTSGTGPDCVPSMLGNNVRNAVRNATSALYWEMDAALARYEAHSCQDTARPLRELARRFYARGLLDDKPLVGLLEATDHYFILRRDDVVG